MIFTADLSQRSHPQLEHTVDWFCELTVKSGYVLEDRRSGCSSWTLSTAQHGSLESFENVISHVTMLSLTQETLELVLPPDRNRSKLWSSKQSCCHRRLSFTPSSPTLARRKKISLNVDSRNTRDFSVFVTGVGGPKATVCLHVHTSPSAKATSVPGQKMNLRFWWRSGVKRTVRDSSVL